jgi:protein-tyrosine phosphatase
MKRMIEMEGCLNFRDLGGYPTADGRVVAWRQLFRSDALHDLSEADVRRLRDELCIEDVVDLRSTAEVAADGRTPLSAAGVRTHHVPLFDGDLGGRQDADSLRNLADRYVLMARFAKAQIARVVTTLAETAKPTVYHCAAGKDRTGVISAVLLGALGVRDEVIATDYAATRQNLDAIIERLMNMDAYQTMLQALPSDTLHAEPETMLSFLQRMRDRYGSMQEYLVEAGVPQTVLLQLEARLLVARDEAAPGPFL